VSWALVTLVTVLGVSQVPGRGDPARPESAVVRGKKLFYDAGLGQSGQSCAHCHATVEDEASQGDGLVRAGHTLANVAGRASWRGDARRMSYPTLRRALEACADVFQGASLAPDDAARLVSFLESISPKRGLPPLVVQPSLAPDLDYDRDEFRGGDAAAGRATFFAACHACHPSGGPGIGPTLRGLAPAAIAAGAREGNGLMRGTRAPGRYAAFFGKDRLRDRDLADVIAFLATLER
jgi:mono/diheme cytochrome c family protein